ncbi:hypothetical protein ABFX02_04G006200 [Erythranthe guttata]
MKTATIHILSLLFCISLFLYSTHAAPNPPLVLTCGSSDAGGNDPDGRKWDPDDKYIISGDKTTAAKADYQDPSLSSTIPYMTARIFQSETTYQFPLQNSTSRTLLRLHFYPSSYPNFNISNSYFSVVAGKFTLLQNFSAFLAAEALSQAYLVKEYYLAPSDMPTLNVTFKPSADQNQSFAFINGIELISSPPIFDEDPMLVGSATSSSSSDFQTSSTVPIETSSMETMYRLNVGGQFISPTNDSGGRSWYDDSVYIYGAGQGVALQANTTISYKDMPSYMAPLDVYSTYRSMGASADLNKNSNLTWIFQVDPNFMYLVRFHWCDSEMTKPNQRVFDVFVNNKTASSEVDLFAMTSSIATPTKEDYAVHVSNKTSEPQIWVTLQPTDKTKAEFADVLLNGLEIFKLSDNAKSSLAGPNPTCSDLMKKYQQDHVLGPKSFDNSNEMKTSKVVITGAAGGAAAVGIAAVIFLAAYKTKKRVPGADQGSSWLPISWNSSSNTTATKSSVLGKSTQNGVSISSDAASNCRYFNLTEIKNATKNFDESNVIGVGGFGKVYKGIVDGNTKVAIKRSNPSSEQGVNEFQTEIEMLSRLRHRHLVSLIGFCEDNGEMILVYDYMGKGTLREHLYKGNKPLPTLSWKQRLEICIGAARGLHYLHTGAKYTIIHRDVKTTNILVDDKWVAKVSDFGLSKTGPNMHKGHVSTVVKGSFGYLDPEYFRRQQLTEKSDVYSFGVVLFEVLCSRPALNPNLPKEQVSLADWALRCARNKTLDELIDPQLKGEITEDCLKKFAETAEKCLADHGSDRPTMGDVLWSLESARQLQEKSDGGGGGGSTFSETTEGGRGAEEIDHGSIMAMHRNTLSLGDEEDVKKSGDKDDSDEIFSLFVNQSGR